MTAQNEISSAREGADLLLVDNPLVGVRTAVPFEVRVDDRYLYWRRDESRRGMKDGRLGFLDGGSAQDAIWHFIELADAEPEAFETFAKRYGVLGIRDDGLPSTAWPVAMDVNPYPWLPGKDGHAWFREDLTHWRMYAVGLRTVLVAAIALRDNPHPEPSDVIEAFGLGKYTRDWCGLSGLDLSPNAEEKIHGIYLRWISFLDPQETLRLLNQDFDKRSPQEHLAEMVTGNWLRLSGLVPRLQWQDGRTSMTLVLGDSALSGYPPNMAFSILVAQLASLLSSEPFERLDHCSVCGRLFVPAIKPGRHMRSFCPEHKLEGERDRKRRWARKQAAARKLASR